MKKIFKYTLPIEYKDGLANWAPSLEIPTTEGAKILSVGLQDGKAMMWVLVDLDAPPINVTVAIVATGEQVPSWIGGGGEKFIGTLIFGVRGDIVLHVFG